MMDIVEWLRQFKLSTFDSNYNALFVNGKTKEAADEIERLREDKAELLEALRSIAYHRKGGPTNNRLAVQLERLAIDAIAKATGEE